MSKVHRTDSHGKPIVHGRRYVFVNRDPWGTVYHGVILWDRDILSHVFQPDNAELKPIVVHYWVREVGGEKWLLALSFVRERKVRDGRVVQTARDLR